MVQTCVNFAMLEWEINMYMFFFPPARWWSLEYNRCAKTQRTPTLSKQPGRTGASTLSRACRELDVRTNARTGAILQNIREQTRSSKTSKVTEPMKEEKQMWKRMPKQVNVNIPAIIDNIFQNSCMSGLCELEGHVEGQIWCKMTCRDLYFAGAIT